MSKRTPKIKHMNEEQIKRIIENNYCGVPSHGYGFDYGADYKDEIDQRLWELQQRKAEKEFKTYEEHLLLEETNKIKKDHFCCYYCKEIKNFSELKKGSFREKYKRGKCKKCHAYKIKKYNQEIKAVPF